MLLGSARFVSTQIATRHRRAKGVMSPRDHHGDPVGRSCAEQSWLTPAVLTSGLASLGVLFGFIRRWSISSTLGWTSLTTSYVDFLKAHFRIPRCFFGPFLRRSFATVDLWLVLSGRLKVGLPSLMTPLVVLYVVYVSIENAADSAARTLTPVTVELKSGGSGPPEAHGYLLIGRIGTTLFLCTTRPPERRSSVRVRKSPLWLLTRARRIRARRVGALAWMKDWVSVIAAIRCRTGIYRHSGSEHGAHVQTRAEKVARMGTGTATVS